ncbi:hypothetical protein [Aequorivita vladivostokensis]|uniref:hypothetical protein n=1 Tax=Aequorivita vladivostokensis TaxID=171194 RepID=UPI000AF22CC1|nr:hypothetical protein [Aequorivita vladivostokensis]
MINNQTLTALATILLVIVGLAQVFVLISQKRQTRIALISEYRKLWNKYRNYYGNIVFIGRNTDEYYQVVNENELKKLKEELKAFSLSTPTIWARESIQKVCGLLSEISTRVLQGHLKVSETYPIFGTEFLRQSRPLRQLLEPEYQHYFSGESENKNHKEIRKEIQEWLIYHDGLRRRCLILIDLLWAEAVRLEDLPPMEMASGADAKKISGKKNRKRIFREIFRLNGFPKILLAFKLSRFLKRAEYYSILNWKGIKKKELSIKNKNWTKRILRE